ncbi:hypothetical protein IFR05_006321 [Cadophora sp. M221]|nr:hypothetical protein IFR05_006321 [Cadophora sp. M221]
MPESSRRDNSNGGNGDKSGKGISSTATSKYYMNKLWTCCQCPDNAAMDYDATDVCSGFHCGHRRCGYCDVEYHKRPLKEPDFRPKTRK